MKKSLFSACLMLVLTSSLAWAQGGKATLDKIQHDFGKIKEENGPVEVNFVVKNTGVGNLLINDVKPSCGCTTPTWTKDAIAPGATGVITAKYDPTGRPGVFNKNVTVTTNGDPAMLNLTIIGEVIPRPKGIKDWYPQESGSMRMTSRSVYMPKVLHDGKATQKLTLYNDGDKIINIRVAESKSQLPAWASVEIPKNAVSPKDSLQLVFTIDATKQSDWDYISSTFMLKTDDAKEADKQLYLSGVVVENFGDIKAGAPAPQAIFDRISHDYGNINQGTTNTTNFVLTNKGNTTLHIRKVKASCGCTAPQPKKLVLAPGESTEITVVYNSHGKEGQQNQSVTVITNDPLRAKQVLTIAANVAKPADKPQGGK